jgi:hypothetical protein
MEQKIVGGEQTHKKGFHISKFVAEHFENSLRQVEEQEKK